MISLLCLSLFVSCVWSAVISRPHPHGWAQQSARVPPTTRKTFRLALHQRNVDVLKAETLKRVMPESAEFGQWLTMDEVLAIVAPERAVVDQVMGWVLDQGMEAEDLGDAVIVRGTVEQIEKALNTKLSYFLHSDGSRHLRTLEFTLPDEINEHVELVAGLQEFWPKSSVGSKKRKVDGSLNNVSGGYIIPEVLRRMYNIPSDAAAKKASKHSSVCTAEFQDTAAFTTPDLRLFERQTGEKRIHIDKTVGPFQNQFGSAEPSLDIEYASALGLDADFWYWTATEWMLEFAQDLFKHPTRPAVVSMSWGWPSPSQCQIGACNGMTSKQYVQRVETEWAKINALGVSLFASSGDQGAPGDTYGALCNGISDIYPGSSVWVTSVGATMINDQATPVPPPPAFVPPPVCSTHKCANILEETTCTTPEALIVSGGGAAAFFHRPQWQDAIVTAYLNNTRIQKPPSRMFNARNRMFADVSANGHAYLIGLNGAVEQVDGTSCSAPVVSAMAALLDGFRKEAGKKPLGFLAPILYAAQRHDPSIFTPQKGNNKCSEGCCGNFGWIGEPNEVAWAPGTGLGTFDFEKLKKYVMSLP